MCQQVELRFNVPFNKYVQERAEMFLKNTADDGANTCYLEICKDNYRQAQPALFIRGEHYGVIGYPSDTRAARENWYSHLTLMEVIRDEFGRITHFVVMRDARRGNDAET